MADDTRLAAQFRFLNEADRLKSVLRANVLIDGSRAENVAEHSWHLALWAMVMGAPDCLPEGCDETRVIAMLLLHDLPEIDCGDHPIHLDHDPQMVAAAEDAAAMRLFDLLPAEKGQEALALWREFEAAQTREARLAKRLDHAQPLFQVLMSAAPLPDHLAIVRENLATGRAARFRQEWPDLYATATAMQNGLAIDRDSDLGKRLAFLAEADRLKTVLRATTLCDGSRRENSGEHSWHLALYALVLSDHAGHGVSIARVIRMLLLHDLVEIDTGDGPIHSANGQAHASAATRIAESQAADRIFGLLPAVQCDEFRALWEEFEAAETPDAIFAKSLDRVQPVMANLMSGGGTWVTYKVTMDQLETRVGAKVARGAPQLWHWVGSQAQDWFASSAVVE